MDSSKVLQRRKPDIPVITQKPSGIDHQKHGVTKCLEIRRVISLLEDPLTAGLKQRHLFVLKKLMKRCQHGFLKLLRELADMSKVLNICAERVGDHPEFVFVLCDALKICRFPFLKEKASDELMYANNVKDFLSQMGCLMRITNTEVRHEICECIKSFYSCVASRQLLDGLQLTGSSYKLQLLEQSGLAETLVLSMVILGDQPAVRLQVLQTLQVLSSSSEVNCALILKAKGAETICLHMNEADPSGQVLVRSSEILCNMLERGYRALRESFFHLLLNASRPNEVQFRNDLLFITTLISGNHKCLLIESLFAKQLIPFITSPELETYNPLPDNVKLSNNNEDFEMKKLLLNLVSTMSTDLAALQLFEEGRVILALLSLVKGCGEGQSAAGHWSFSQQEELQLKALVVLGTVAPLMVEDYMACRGNTQLLMLLRWCSKQDGRFSGRQGVAGRGSRIAQVRYCVRALRTMSSLCCELLNRDLCDQGAISQLLGILMQMEAYPNEEDVVTVEIKSDMQLILSALCESDLHRKELFGSEGVEMTVHFLKTDPERFHRGLGNSKLLLTTVDCVWSCIVGCYTTEDYFLAKEGVFLLLEILNSGLTCTFSGVLATLVELCDNTKTPSHVLAWRGGDGCTAPALLLRLWREEEAEMGVARDAYGRITDPHKALLSCFQEDDTQLHFHGDRPSATILDMSENLRAKIYSIFCKIGFHNLPGLSTTDYITLSIVKRYLDFKVGEVWQEVIRELRKDGVRPVSPDAETMEALSKTAEDTALRVVEEQNGLLELEKEEERLAYAEIRAIEEQKERIIKAWNHYVSKTSDYNFLKEVKLRRQKFMESSADRPTQDEAVVHPSEIFLGRVLSFEQPTPSQPTFGPNRLAGVRLSLQRVPIPETGPAQGLPRDPGHSARSPEAVK